jgi:hypothetical protein
MFQDSIFNIHNQNLNDLYLYRSNSNNLMLNEEDFKIILNKNPSFRYPK